MMETYLNGIEDHCDRKIARTEVSRKENLQNTKKTTNEHNPGRSAPQQVSSSSAHTKLFCSSSFQNFSNKQNMCTTREYPKKTPAIPECLTIQKQKRTNNNSSNGITGAIRDDAHGGEKERERECGRARVERRKTEALSGSHRGPKLVKWEALTESV
jgi:hypothetical protein